MTLFNRIIFFIVVFSIIFSLQLLVFSTFRRFLLRNNLSKKLSNLITLLPLVLFTIPYIIFLINRFDIAFFPDWFYKFYIIPFFVFQGATFFIGLYLLTGKIIKFPFLFIRFFMKKIKYLRERYNEIVKRKDIVTFNESRRKFITASAAAVSGYAFIGAGIGAIQKDNYQIIEKDITIKNLPAELRGINIILFSDIHSGPYMNEDMMREYTNVINGMNPDLILIPGDMTNSQKTEVIPFTKAFRDLKSKYGIYGTLGNHDYFNDANYIADAIINESPVRMLRNNSATVEIKGKFINILGIEDTRDSGVNNNALLVKYADEALNTLNINHTANPNILLCHKPYVFDDLSQKGFDLILSGHTHGGQIVFAKFAGVNLSIAATVNKYIDGLYRSGDSQMYVSRGIGTVGLPIRLNCPPEITKITLV